MRRFKRTRFRRGGGGVGRMLQKWDRSRYGIVQTATAGTLGFVALFVPSVLTPDEDFRTTLKRMRLTLSCSHVVFGSMGNVSDAALSTFFGIYFGNVNDVVPDPSIAALADREVDWLDLWCCNAVCPTSAAATPGVTTVSGYDLARDVRVMRKVDQRNQAIILVFVTHLEAGTVTGDIQTNVDGLVSNLHAPSRR